MSRLEIQKPDSHASFGTAVDNLSLGFHLHGADLKAQVDDGAGEGRVLSLNKRTLRAQIVDASDAEDPPILTLYLATVVDALGSPAFLVVADKIRLYELPDQLVYAVAKIPAFNVPMRQRMNYLLGLFLIR